MKLRMLTAASWLCLVLTLIAWQERVHAAETVKRPQPKIYDESADGAKQVSEALATARKENKHVLLQFGANWCGWCHKLHKLFDQDKGIAQKLKGDYVVVMIDVDKGHNQKLVTKYGNPTRFGLPVISGSGCRRQTTDDARHGEVGRGGPS